MLKFSIFFFFLGGGTKGCRRYRHHPRVINMLRCLYMPHTSRYSSSTSSARYMQQPNIDVAVFDAFIALTAAHPKSLTAQSLVPRIHGCKYNASVMHHMTEQKLSHHKNIFSIAQEQNSYSSGCTFSNKIHSAV